jgi:hypothetical protein
MLVRVAGARPVAVPEAGRPTASEAKKCCVEVETVNTGEKSGYDPVFEVAVRNRCRCAVRSVSLRSEGFASDGRRIESAAAVRFRYAWDRAFRMTPAAVHDDCSWSLPIFFVFCFLLRLRAEWYY